MNQKCKKSYKDKYEIESENMEDRKSKEIEKVKIGLEIHQRLATKTKLFCKCSTKGNENKVKEIRRRLHVVPSELGEIDVAALFESQKSPLHKYDFYKDTCCLVETDDEPPHDANREAIIIGLMICNMLNAEIVDEIHFMRKTVIDGSNTSGFQRTAIIGMNGKLKYNLPEKEGGENEKKEKEVEKEIGIQTIAIEEESCGIIGEQKGEIESFRLDRLGIPLVEIATTPDIESGKEARIVAEKIGLMLRSTGKMMRGIGTIRQDLNVSVPHGARIEIKGVQELDLIETVVENEISRQKKLLEICEKIKSIRKNNPQLERLIGSIEKNDKILEAEIKDVTHFFSNTQSKMIKKGIENGKSVFALKFPGMKGLFGIELYPDYRYGSELSDYAKTQGLGGIIHSDEDIERYGMKNEVAEIARILKLNPEDGWIIVIGEKEQCISALKLVFKRAYETKVPEETRKADINGKTHYMRPLPGSARMYPETDIEPIRINDALLEESKNFLSFDEIEQKVRSVLNKEMADKIIRSEKLHFFLELVEEGINPMIAAVTCEDALKSLRRDGFDISLLSEDEIKEVLISYRDGKIAKAAIIEILKEIIKEKSTQATTEQETTAGIGEKKASDIIQQAKYRRISGEELLNLIRTEKIKDMQTLMMRYRLNIEPQEAAEALKKIITENMGK